MERRLAAILAADMVGYSRLMAADEAGTIERQKSHRADLIDPKIAQYSGRIVKTTGDGMLVEFPSVVDAVQCALDIQREMPERETEVPDTNRIRYRIGINMGDIVLDGDDILGDGVNIAARLEGLSEPGGLCISDVVHQNIQGKIDLEWEDLGEQTLKNMERKVRAWHWLDEARQDGYEPRVAAKSPPLPDKPSIAVLPFTNMSGDPEQEYFSDGITEDIITELSRFRELFVIARNSCFSYKGKSVKVQDIGRDLGVSYVVEGSVRRAGDRVRITAQLIEAGTGNHVWAERFDRKLDDIFDLQDEITQIIVARLPVRLHDAMLERARKKPSSNLTAYDLFLQGRWLLDRAFWQDSQALELLDKAVELDPHCAHARAYIALVHAYSVFTFYPLGADPLATARKNIEQALSEGEGDHFIHAVAGEVYLVFGDHDLAMSHSNKSLALNPNDIFALNSYGLIVAYSGDPEAAVEHLNKVLRYDPLTPEILCENLAESYYLIREYEKALETYQKWQKPPVHTYTHLAACYAQLGQMEDARAAVRAFEKKRPPDADFAYYASAHARLCKRPEHAEHWLEGYRKAGLIV